MGRLRVPFMRLLAALGTAAILVACHDGNDDLSRTTSTIAAQEIAGNSSETSVPIELNDLPISDSDSSETALPVPLD